MVEEGLGIAILPRVSVERELKLGILAEVEIIGVPRFKRQIALIFRRNRKHARAVHAFVETLHNMYRFILPESAREVFPDLAPPPRVLARSGD
jgi:DNA-binding transcriptional LysR family regulator